MLNESVSKIICWWYCFLSNTTIIHIFPIIIVTTIFFTLIHLTIQTCNHHIPGSPTTNRSCTTCTNGDIFVIRFVKLDVIFTFVASLFAKQMSLYVSVYCKGYKQFHWKEYIPVLRLCKYSILFCTYFCRLHLNQCLNF